MAQILKLHKKPERHLFSWTGIGVCCGVCGKLKRDAVHFTVGEVLRLLSGEKI